ncbi:MAG: DoxX family protein [Patescibacteria group bacterium]
MKMSCYKNKSLGLLVLRLFVGGIFLVHGIQKFMNMDGTIQFFAQIGLNSFWAYVVAFTETLGGTALVLGLFVQYASALLSIVLLVAIIMVKYKFGGPTLLGKFAAGEVDLALLGANLALVCAGGGRYALSKFCKCHKEGGTCKVCSVMGCETGDCAGKCEGNCSKK